MAQQMNVGERLGDTIEQDRRGIESAFSNARFCVPGIIHNFNAEKQTAEVQPAIRECVTLDNKKSDMNLPLLLDVPVQFPRAGGYAITFPVKKGDECLVVFGDMCIDAWWQSGGIQSQMEIRRHDLSDAFAILAVTSVPNAVKNYSANTFVIKHEGTNTYMEIDKKIINIKAETINITADINIIGNITVMNGDVVVDGISLKHHTHIGVHGETSEPLI